MKNIVLNQINHKRNLLFVVPFSLALIVINFIRMIRIPITHDEVGYSPDCSYRSIITEEVTSANNHIFHSVLRKFFIEAFGNSNELITRIDSGLAHIVFIVFSYLLCKYLFKRNYWLLVSFITLNVISPFVFNFWGLSRGYGLCMCFMTISIYYLLVYEGKRQLKWLAYSLLAAIFTVWSNFSLINYFMALSGVLVLRMLLFRSADQEKNIWRKEVLMLLGTVVVLGLMITGPLLKLMKGGEMQFLGINGFIQDTVESLAKCHMFRIQIDTNVHVLSYVWVGISLLISVFWVVTYFRLKLFKNPASLEIEIGIVLNLLLMLVVLSVVAQHALLNVSYLLDRTAVFMLLLFAFQSLYFFYYVASKLRLIGTVLFTVFFALSGYNFCRNIDLNSAYIWWYSRDDMLVLNRIMEQQAGNRGQIRILAGWEFIPPFNYNLTHHFADKAIILDCWRGGKEISDSTYDYLYFQSEFQSLVPRNYYVDIRTVDGNFMLCRRKDTTLPAAK